ncbi:MAG: hypothetical protein ACMUIL_11825 [bacterium]
MEDRYAYRCMAKRTIELPLPPILLVCEVKKISIIIDGSQNDENLSPVFLEENGQ